jgi:hypothetical protein
MMVSWLLAFRALFSTLYQAGWSFLSPYRRPAVLKPTINTQLVA